MAAKTKEPDITEEMGRLHIDDGTRPVQHHKQSAYHQQILNIESSAKDITSEFISAASALKTGQLVKDGYFTLFEAVGALEIMDPKMDSGYLASGETLDDEYDVLSALLPEEVIGIMDQLLCSEMAWHMGRPLSQTLFTSYYIDRLLWSEPETLDQACFDRDHKHDHQNQLLHLVLRAYCLALIKACDFVHRRISTAHFYEEEDFVSNLYNRNLLSNIEASEIESCLDRAIEYVDRGIDLKTKALEDAILNRLEFRKVVLQAIGGNFNLSKSSQADPWTRCLDLLPNIMETKSFGVPANHSFSAKIQRKLASNVPPRPIVESGFEDAYDYFRRLCENGNEVYRADKNLGSSNLMNFVWSFQLRNPNSSIYIRCLLQSIIESEMMAPGKISLEEFANNNLEEIVLPASMLLDPTNEDVEAPHDPRFQVFQKMRAFSARAGEYYLDIFRALCMNRSRLRRMLCHLILDWDGLQLDAEVLDMELRVFTKEESIKENQHSSEVVWSFPLSSWAYYHKLHQMEWIVQLGFELEIYQTSELAGTYWYLQYLASTRLHHLERIRMFTTRSFARLPAPTSKQSAAFSRSFSFLKFAMLEASAIQSFADGLSCLYSFLTHIGLVPNSDDPCPYGTPSLRYSLRMQPFLSISLPEVPTYAEFTALVSLRGVDGAGGENLNASADKSKEQVLSILDIADQAMKVARKEWDAVSKTDPETARCLGFDDWWKSSMRDVVRACIAGNIAVATAKKAFTVLNGRNAKEVLKVHLPEKDKRYHTWWVVPNISTR